MASMEQQLLDTIDHIRKVQTHLGQLADRLHVRARMHDQSKLQEPELSGYAGLSEAVKYLQYGTDEYRTAFEPFKQVIQHHYVVNDHHPEHFKIGIDGMNLLQLSEMIADWKAASMRNNDSLLPSLDASFKRFGIDGQLAQIIRNTILDLEW